MRRRKNFVDRS